ncbi:MAG: hypothetical protein COC03_08090 [Robiginitomaculum sp.]|nr:MAG: hypothetical protein COC03_08090 [Robiginitomaculum sp.]
MMPILKRQKVIALKTEDEFSYPYYIFIPETISKSPEIFVTIHGITRNAAEHCLRYAQNFDLDNTVIIAPLFSKDAFKHYQILRANDKGKRPCEALDVILDDVATRLEVCTNQFTLSGYSGGGQFAHRYLYLNPNKLIAVSVGAPGTVSQLDPSLKWWPGTANFKELFGHEPNLKAMRGVNIQLIIGENDTETRDVTVSEFSQTWTVGANDAGINRRDRLSTLNNNITDHGMRPEITIVPDVAHEGMRILDEVKAFFSRVLS